MSSNIQPRRIFDFNKIVSLDSLPLDIEKCLMNSSLQFMNLSNGLQEAYEIIPQSLLENMFGIPDYSKRLLESSLETIAKNMPSNGYLVDYGCGSGEKAIWLFEQLEKMGVFDKRRNHILFLDNCIRAYELAVKNATEKGIIAEGGFSELFALTLSSTISNKPGTPFYMILGGTLGNLPYPRWIFSGLSDNMKKNECLLIEIDQEKDLKDYDNSQGRALIAHNMKVFGTPTKGSTISFVKGEYKQDGIRIIRKETEFTSHTHFVIGDVGPNMQVLVFQEFNEDRAYSVQEIQSYLKKRFCDSDDAREKKYIQSLLATKGSGSMQHKRGDLFLLAFSKAFNEGYFEGNISKLFSNSLRSQNGKACKRLELYQK